MADTTASRLIVEVEGKGVRKTASEMGRLDNQIVSTNRSAGNLSGGMSGLSKIAGAAAVGFAALTAAGFQMAKSSLKNAAALEQNQIALTTMLKSAKKANALLKEFRDFGAATPFETTEIIKSGKQMVAFGFAADKVTDNLKMIGDVAAGIGVPLGELSEIYSKIFVSNQVYAEDLNQLAGRGVPIFKELTKVTGKNAVEIKKMASEGKLGFKEIEKAFQNMTKQGGSFSGLMQAQSRSLSGLWSTFKSQVTEASISVGNEMVPAMKDLLTELTNSEVVVPFITNLFKIMGNVIGKVAQVATWAVRTIEDAGKTMKAADNAKEIKRLEVQLAAIRKERDKYYKGGKADIKVYNELVKAHRVKIVELKIAQEKFTIQQNKAFSKKQRNTLVSTTKDYAKLTKEINQGTFKMGVLTKLGRQYLGRTTDPTQIKKNLKETIDASGKALVRYQNNIDDAQNKIKVLKNELKGLTGTDLTSGFKPKDMISSTNVVKKNVKKIRTELEKLQDFWGGVAEKANSIAQPIMDIFNSISQLIDATTQKQIESLDKRMQAELKAAGVAEKTEKEKAKIALDEAKATGDAKAILEAENALKRAEIEEKYAKKRMDLEYKGALASWQMDTALAAASAPLAILNAVAAGAKFGLAGMIAFGAAAAAQTGIQLAALAAAKPSPPTAQFGGSFMVPPGNPADSGMIKVNQGEQVDVTPVSKSGGGMPDKMVLQIGERDFEAYLTDKMNKIANSGRFNITRTGVVKTI